MDRKFFTAIFTLCLVAGITVMPAHASEVSQDRPGIEETAEEAETAAMENGGNDCSTAETLGCGTTEEREDVSVKAETPEVQLQNDQAEYQEDENALAEETGAQQEEAAQAEPAEEAGAQQEETAQAEPAEETGAQQEEAAQAEPAEETGAQQEEAAQAEPAEEAGAQQEETAQAEPAEEASSESPEAAELPEGQDAAQEVTESPEATELQEGTELQEAAEVLAIAEQLQAQDAAVEAVSAVETGQEEKSTAAEKIKSMKLEVIDFGKSGYGDGQMLSSGGERLLIDTYVKESWTTVNKWLYDHNYTSFDIYISHYHDDHMDNVTKILNDGKYKVSTLYLPDFKYMTGTSKYMEDYIKYYKNVINTAKSKGVKIVFLNKGSSFSVGDVTANVLWGNDYRCSEHDLHYINNNSLLTRFTCGETRYLNGGDLEAESERLILNAKVDVKADIFKLNHHGGSTSNTEAFLKAVNASFCYFNFCGDSPSRYAKESFCYEAPRKANKYGNVASVRYNGDITYYVYDDVISQDLKRNYTEQNVYLYNKTDTKKLEGVITQKLNTACTKRIDNRAYGDYSCSTSKKAGTHADEAWLLGNAGMQYYCRDNAPVTGWTKIDGHIYHFNTKTAKKDTGWKTYGGFRFYFNWAGQMQTGSVKIGNARYHFNENGHQTKGGWAVTDGNRYYVNPSTGTVMTGVRKVNGKIYYFGSTGILVKHPGFIKIGGKIYYGCKDGSMKTGWLNVNGKTYFMNADGSRHTGWLKRGSKRFYFASNGVMLTQTGFVKLGGKTYYVCKDSSMKTGWLKSGGKLYYMNSDGSRHTGWLKVNGKLYYMNVDGTIHTGWLKIGSKRFYFASNGVMKKSC